MGDPAISFASNGLPGEDPFDLEGDLLDGQFRVETLVGEGELSVVYRGLHEGVNAPIAIKCLNLPQTLDPKLVEPISESFREGARLHYRLARGHLHIVQTLACGDTLAPRTGQLVPYVVREWLEGRSLSADFAARARAKVRLRTPIEAVELLESAADAIAHAHAEGVAHHSLSPRNLFLAKTREAEVLKVLDFGLARPPHAGASRSGPTDPGLRLLFSSYAAPEQLDRRIGDVSAATDVFAFALVLFEAIAGRPYFPPGTHASEVLRIASVREPLSRRVLDVVLPRDFELVLSRALAPVPRERPADLRAFWTDVKNTVRRSSGLRPAFTAPKPPPPAVPVATKPPPPAVPVATKPPPPAVAVVAFPPPPAVIAFPPPPSVVAGPAVSTSSWTGEVAPPVTTSSTVPAASASAPDETPPAAAPRDLNNADTTPAPRMAQDAALGGPPVDDWLTPLRALRSRMEQRLAAGSPFAPAQLGAIAASVVVGCVLVTASLWRAAPTATASRTSPDARMVRTVAAEPTALVLTEARSVAARRFDRTAAIRALDETAAGLESCTRKGSPRGPGSIRVLIHPNGQITSLQIGWPYARTATGQCIRNRFLETPLPSFAGPLLALNSVFGTIPFE
jgi:serine/threonine-protein kinase